MHNPHLWLNFFNFDALPNIIYFTMQMFQIDVDFYALCLLVVLVISKHYVYICLGVRLINILCFGLLLIIFQYTQYSVNHVFCWIVKICSEFTELY